MELHREHFRLIIFHNFRLNKSALMILIQFLKMKLHQGSMFTDGGSNRGRSSLQEEFREGHPKSVFVAETMRQLILQGRHVPYRDIVITLGISRTSIA